MFIVFGVLSVALGVYCFSQADKITALMKIVNASPEIGATWTAIAIGFLLAGILVLCCSKGQKRALVVLSTVCYAVLTVMAGLHFTFGDMAIYTIAALIMFVVYLVWLLRHKRVKASAKPDSTPASPSV